MNHCRTGNVYVVGRRDLQRRQKVGPMAVEDRYRGGMCQATGILVQCARNTVLRRVASDQRTDAGDEARILINQLQQDGSLGIRTGDALFPVLIGAGIDA